MNCHETCFRGGIKTNKLYGSSLFYVHYLEKPASFNALVIAQAKGCSSHFSQLQLPSLPHTMAYIVNPPPQQMRSTVTKTFLKDAVSCAFLLTSNQEMIFPGHTRSMQEKSWMRQ